jgi:mono/diheme cytochrome c family protein
MTRYLILFSLAAVCACNGAEETSTPMSAAEPEGPTEVEMVAAMEAHYTSAILAHDALVQGDVAGFRARLAEFDSHELPPSSPDQWKPFDAQLRAAASGARDATEIGTAASTMAAVVLACGVCHQSTASGPVYPAPPLGEDGEHTDARMRKHEWSVLMLWDGVTGPSDYAWDEGSKGVAESQIFGEETGRALLAREATLRGLGEEAKTTISLPDRAMLYARILATCGDCHQAAGVELPYEGTSPAPGP